MPAVANGADSWLTRVSEALRPKEETEGSGAPHTDNVVTKKPPLGFTVLSTL